MELSPYRVPLGLARTFACFALVLDSGFNVLRWFLSFFCWRLDSSMECLVSRDPFTGFSSDSTLLDSYDMEEVSIEGLSSDLGLDSGWTSSLWLRLLLFDLIYIIKKSLKSSRIKKSHPPLSLFRPVVIFGFKVSQMYAHGIVWPAKDPINFPKYLINKTIVFLD